MKVELFHAPGCDRCAAAAAALETAAREAVPNIIWREVDVLDELDYAVELGVLSLPAVVIDRELVFASLPTARQLCRALANRARKSL